MELTPEQLKRKLDAGERLVLLDCREDGEWAHCRIDGAVHIPMRQIPERVDELEREASLVVYCHHGVRSRQVAEYLRQQGFERVANLSGGIDRWAIEVDPAIPRY